MRKVFLDELPRWEKGRYKGKISWSESIGYRIPFIYKNIEGELEIVNYNKDIGKVEVRYKDITSNISTDGLLKGAIGSVIQEITKEFKYEIGLPFKDDKRDLVITDREYRKDKKGQNRKYYKYTCTKCGWTEGWMVEPDIKKGIGCACCARQTLVPEINSIWARTPWMIDLGMSKEDAKNYMPCSTKKVRFICPDCGMEKHIIPNIVYYSKSIFCKCSDGSSYPEKILTSLLNQLNIKFQAQLSKTTFEWCEDKRYDFYLPEYNMIIETHGGQHYNQTSRGRSLAEERENDRVKRELALSNGIENYIELDCRYSELEWIKNSILGSKLNELFDLSEIDWNVCEDFALRNIIKEVCNYWNNKEGWETTTTIAENNPWGIKSYATIGRYLKKGSKLGWCSYDPNEEVFKRRVKASQSASKKCSKQVEIFKDGKSLGMFDSCNELARQSEELFGVILDARSISSVASGKRKTHKGFTLDICKIKKERNDDLSRILEIYHFQTLT